MKVVLINGSPHPKGCTYTALKEVADTLERNGVESEILQLGARGVPGCIGCYSCQKTGRCAMDDQVNRLVERLDEIDGLVIGSPVYYSGPTGQIMSFMDRFCFVAGSRLWGKPAAAVVSCRRGGATASFQQLNQFFTMNNMPVVSSQYWNQVHGFTPDDVRQDLEGMQTMRTLGNNMAWLLKCIELGKKHGIMYPENEPVVLTHFIR